MNAIVVSDLHIGSHHFLYNDFELFLENVSEDYELILNGDIIDNPYENLKPPHQRILDLIEQKSYRQNVVWVRGNHDNGYMPKRFEKVNFTSRYNLGHRLLIAHGDYFDEIMPRTQVFMLVFELIHDLRAKKYNQKWEFLYKFLRKNVMLNAVNYAMENGYEAITCGHTHYPEDIILNGIRYINTGAWTEFPVCYLQVTDGELYLKTLY